MTLPPPAICRRIRKLHALLGSTNTNESAAAHKKLRDLLAEYGLTWNDLPELLAADVTPHGGRASAASTSTSGATPGAASQGDKPQVNVLNLVDRLLELHIAVTPEQRIAIALWVLHSHVFGRFQITPRLALVSPVRGCGKTTLLILLEQLCADPYRSDNATPAAIYHTLAGREPTLLMDEGDNLGLTSNNILRSVFNAGHRRGGAVSRFVAGRPKKFPVFAPLAIATIGALPLPIMHRAVVISMERRPAGIPLEQLDENSPVFSASRAEIEKWAETCKLNPRPEMPAKLHNRPADNWRVLLSIADDLGHGEAARAAAIALSAKHSHEDAGVIALTDIRTIFSQRRIDRITSVELVEALVGVDGSMWHAWGGPKDDRPPHKLTQAELAALLRPFHIHPRTVWRLGGRRERGGSSRGYMRSQFEEAWQSYCSADDTPTQGNVIGLGLHRRRRS